MAPLAVVKAFDVFLYCGVCIGTGWVLLMMHQFVFQAPSEAFHWGVAIPVPLARHGRLHAKLLNQLLIIMSTILAPTVRMMNQARGWALVTHRPPQGLRRQLLRHAFAHRVANQFAGKHVLDASDIEPALAGGK